MHGKTESQVDEGAFKQAQIEIQDWAEKYNKFKSRSRTCTWIFTGYVKHRH